jgi:malonyl-CoA O-methyltransferase
MEQLTLTYVDVAALLRDLQAHGSKSTGGEQQQGLFGRSRYRRVIAQYEPMRRADGRLPATFEVIYGHAWKPQPRRAASGKPVIEIRPA